VLTKARVRNDVGEVMALGAHRIRAVATGVQRRVRNQIRGNECTRPSRGPRSCGYLAELVATFKDVKILRPMRSIRPRSTELAIIVAIMTVGAEDARAHQARLYFSGDIPHRSQQARLGCKCGIAHHRMRRHCRKAKLRDEIQWVNCGCSSHWRVAVDRQGLFIRAAAMAAKAVFVLIRGRPSDGGSVQRHSGNPGLGRAKFRGGVERRRLA